MKQSAAERWPYWVLAVAGLAGLGGRLSIAEHVTPERYAIDGLFDALARNLAAGNGFTLDGAAPSAHVGPLYPAVLAAWYAVLGHHPEWTPFLHLLFDTAGAWFIFASARRLFDARVGALAASAFFLYPAYWTYDFRLRNESLLTLLVAAWLWSLVAWRQDPRRRRALVAGLLAGVAALCKPVMIPAAAAAAAVPFLTAKAGRDAAAQALLYAAMACMLILPWTYRNQRAFGEWMPVSTGVGVALWAGSDPDSGGSWPMTAEQEARLWKTAGIAPLTYPHMMFEVPVDRVLRDKGLARIKADPVQYGRLALARFVHFWIGNRLYLANSTHGVTDGFRLDAGQRGWVVATYSLAKRLLLVPALLALACWAWWTHRQRWRDLFPLWVIPLGVAVAYSPLMMESGRYALPVLPCLFVLAAAAIARGRPLLATGHATPSLAPPLVVTELAGSAQYGGGERYLELLLARLDRRRFTPLVICPEPGPFSELMRGGGVRTLLVRLAPLINPLAVIRLARVLARERVAVLQTHGARSNAYGLVAGRLAGVPVIIATIHNSLHDYEVGPVRRWCYRVAQRLTIRLADRVVCVSEALRRYIIDDAGVPPSRAVTVYNGVEPDRDASAPRAAAVRAGLHIDTGPMVLAVGRLVEQKGHRYLLKALPDLLREWPKLRCVIVGDGELRNSLLTLAERLGVAEACLFAGVRTDVRALLAAADVVALPSVSEGFPFVLLEGLAMGRPVVATAVAGVDELIEDRRTGRLVPARDARALADAIRGLLRDPAAASVMGREGRRLVQERFTAERMVSGTTSVFESALSERGLGS